MGGVTGYSRTLPANEQRGSRATHCALAQVHHAIHRARALSFVYFCAVAASAADPTVVNGMHGRAGSASVDGDVEDVDDEVVDSVTGDGL